MEAVLVIQNIWFISFGAMLGPMLNDWCMCWWMWNHYWSNGVRNFIIVSFDVFSSMSEYQHQVSCGEPVRAICYDVVQLVWGTFSICSGCGPESEPDYSVLTICGPLGNSSKNVRHLFDHCLTTLRQLFDKIVVQEGPLTCYVILYRVHIFVRV